VKTANRYDRWEWAGAFGDLGTLIPFVLAYANIVKLDPVGIIFVFGAAKIAVGLYYRTPVPVQPQKLVGAAATAQAGAFSPEAVWAAGLFSGAVWLLLGASGAIGLVARLARKPVTQGIMLGLGFSFMLEGLRCMQADWLLAGAGFLLALVLLGNGKIPAMLALLVLGVTWGVAASPPDWQEVGAKVGLHFPRLLLLHIDDPAAAQGILLLALPQLPLTLGNAVIGIVAENNMLFPHRRLAEREVAISTGIINLVAPFWGGVPMCHGAGGMAGHVRFGARTGGALVILGSLLVVLALFFGGAITVLFALFPRAILGTVLFFAGLELALTAWRPGEGRSETGIALITAALTVWNAGVAFALGIFLAWATEKGWIRL